MTFSRGKTVLLRPSGVLMVRWYVLNLLGCGAVPWILPILFETLSFSIGSTQKEMQIALASEWKQRGENENNIGERASQTLRLISSSLLKFQEFGFEKFRSGIPGSVKNRGVFSDDKATIWMNRCVSKWRRQKEGRKEGRWVWKDQKVRKEWGMQSQRPQHWQRPWGRKGFGVLQNASLVSGSL